ncbi:diaminopropionate ammonia-lyase [Oricola sp.]|uniref:diaminopropionate ammonia-lyase n=1 Tax=Oricola sp. TaxID=1979950 RepID=UPI0025F2D169|nr:diaminopropionate ammonia-lyase [Oricola sp.]MCI5075805.1 diaminopropionate ammonia-lyase [Oricola sp.]
MREIIANPHRGSTLTTIPDLPDEPVSTDIAGARALFARCPAAAETPLRDTPSLAAVCGVARVTLKDERNRMGLGSFKALGAAYAIAKMAMRKAGGDEDAARTALNGITFVCASAGNHGLSVAAGARLFGANAVIYLAETVPPAFAARLEAKGATVVREGADYDASMTAALKAAHGNGWYLLSDSSWEGYSVPARDVMEGYLIMAGEVGDAIEAAPTHVFLQAGVGGLAAACAAAARAIWGSAPIITVVEPDRAPALLESVRAGKPVHAAGLESNMGRLDCKDPSFLALAGLARDADFFMTITDEEADAAVARVSGHGIETTPSGVAGIAGLLTLTPEARATLRLDERSRVLAYVSEGPVDGGA